MTDERRKVEVRDVMKKKYDIIDGMMSVNEAMKAMKYRENKSLIVEKRDEHDEYGMVLISDIARKVLAPADYLPPGTSVVSGMPPNADIVVAVGVIPSELSASGYRLYVFYP